MEEINDLETELFKGTNEFTDKKITISGNGLFLTESSLENIRSLSFHNCKFIGSYLEFEDINSPDFLLGFFDCSIEIELEIKNCDFKRLGFRDIKSNKSINIQHGKYSDFFFKNNNLNAKKENLLNGNFNISHLNISKKFEMDYINHVNGNFNFSDNMISIIESESEELINFQNSTFNNAKFINSKFNSKTSFEEMEIIKTCVFEKCEFNKVNFSNLIIGKISFFDCKFIKTSVFHYIEGDISSNISFESCLFEKYIQFNGTNSYSFGLDNVEFNKIASFQETQFETIFIDRTIFEKGALFDDIQIKNLESCDRKTLRTIKREFVNTHNQIDYLRFKAYELNAYKREKGKDWKDNIILYFNKDSNYFGLDWTKGIQFIIKWSFLFYLMYLISYMYVIKCFHLKPSQSDFYVNYIKFSNPLSFLNPPLKNSENYFLPLLFLSLGKIFVSYGIYQTIQAFRKFGVNGG